MEEKSEIRMHFSLNRFLMYNIQDITKRSSVDILAFFNDLARSIAHVGLQKAGGRGIRKDIEDFYPSTSIPFKMLVKGHKAYNHGSWNPHTRMYDPPSNKVLFDVSVEIGFPDNSLRIPEEKLKAISEALAERELLGGEGINLPPFEKPEPKTPKMYKKMMEDICGKVTSTSKRIKDGFDPDPITGQCKNCNGVQKGSEDDVNNNRHVCRCAEYAARNAPLKTHVLLGFPVI